MEDLLRRVVAAWNRRDASSFADFYTPDADYITGEGDWLHGQRAIAELVRATASIPDVAIVGPISIRDHGGISTAVLRWGTGPGSVAAGVISCVIVKHGDRWKIDRLQNTDNGLRE